MDRSQYLIQALQNMGQAPAAPQQAAPDLTAMASAAQDRQAWEQANPGQSHAKHKLGLLMSGLQNAPGGLLAAPGNAVGGLLAAPRNLGGGLAGLFGLGRGGA